MIATANKHSDKIAELSKNILDDNPVSNEYDLTLDEFATLFHRLSSQGGKMRRTDVVLQNDRAIVQFTNLGSGKYRVFVVSDRRLTVQDFTRIIPNATFHGDVLTTSLRMRLKEERSNIVVAAILGLLMTAALFILGNSVASDYGDYLANPSSYETMGLVVDFLVQVNQLILVSVTIFLSIFLVFTVAQSNRLQEDYRLFDNGLLHKFERDDRLVALVALSSLILSIFNVIIIALPKTWEILVLHFGSIITITLNKISIIAPFITGLAVAGLVFSFLSLLYYLKRTMLITNRNMSIKVLDMARRSGGTEENSNKEH